MTSNTETKEPEAPTAAGGQVERVVMCACHLLCFACDHDLLALKYKRHHAACPRAKIEKYPRLFYYEESENCWIPAPDTVDSIVSLDSFLGHGDTIEIIFKRIDMTDEEYDNMPEA